MRYDKGIGISNGILSTLKEVSFGIYHFQMGLMFRTSLLLNGILFNTEAMFSVTDKHISTLEETDRYLLRQILGTGTETPIESLYIETASLPVKYIWKGRRIMYYWTMLHKGEDEIAKQVFSAMKEFPSKKSDWMTQLNEDLRYFDIEETEEEITKMKRDKFKEIVDKKIRIKASENLTKLQMKHSKSMYLYQNDVMAEYLTKHILLVRQKQMLFRL